MIDNKVLSPKKNWLLFGGVYSNLQALEKMKSIAEERGFKPDEIICNGDMVGYCAQPEESVQLIKEWGIHCIIGNVEEQLREGADDCGCDFEEGTRCDVFSRQWFPFAQNALSASSIEWMKELPRFLEFRHAGINWKVVHGAYDHISTFIFHSTPWEKKEEQLRLADADGIVAGHCGLPFSQKKDNKYWINPGVIGMPANDGNTAVWYAILSENTNRVQIEHHNFRYDHVEASRLMLEKGLPTSYAKTLQTGIWDNCEILPEEETLLQGKRIQF